MAENVFLNASLTGATTVSGSINFSGAQISGMYKRHVGLGLCDNTSDMDKPISKAVQSALDNIVGNANSGGVSASLNSYAPKASPVFTGSVTLPAPTDASSNQAATTSFVMNKLYDISNNKFSIVPVTITNVIPIVGAMVFSTVDQKLYICAQDASAVVSWFEVGATQVV
jgi:hypothetical protein